MYPSSSTAWSTLITELLTVPLSLNIAVEEDIIEVSWPASAANFRLQTTSSLAPANWIDVNQSPTVDNGLVLVTLPATPGTAFFRLIK